MRSTHPDIAAEFDMERNAPITPDTVTAGTNKDLHWICSECSHEWAATGHNRVGRNETGCPACANKVIHKDGRNSMRSTHPHLAAEFDMERNAPLTPDTVVAGTNQKLHWNCPDCSYDWTAVSNSRSSGGRGCPHCAVSGFNSLLPADYYVLEIFEKGWPILYKGGITNNEGNRREKELARRFNKHLDSKHWNLVLVEKMHFASGIDAEKLERRLLGAGEIRAPSIEKLSTELFLEHPLDYARERGWV